MKAIPVLQSERLILRGIAHSDFEAMVGFYASEASAFVGGPCDAPETWRRVASYAGGWLLRGYGKFAVEEKTGGRFIGLVGPWFPEGWPEAEIAWTILPEFQGHGFGTEAARLSLRYAYQELGWRTAVSCIDAENSASIRLAERLGARLEGQTEIKPFGPALLYRHLPPAQFLATFTQEQGAV